MNSRHQLFQVLVIAFEEEVSESRKVGTCERRGTWETRKVHGIIFKIGFQRKHCEVGQRGQASGHYLRCNARNTSKSEVGKVER